ncbi:PPA1309 family protein [Cellulomonas septica]|uniref:DUF6596 domain-containing protein n=1 Tax=Cellulomonas septica TaxID=285080 RepID=A0ABX1JXC3_9CELL|nr:hypothetical protein [Cellulomonas septica]
MTQPPTAPHPGERALADAVREVEHHVAGAGWDAPVRVFALVRTQSALATEPGLADQLTHDVLDAAAADPWHLTSVEQEGLPSAPDLETLLAGLSWPDAVDGVAVTVERVVLHVLYVMFTEGSTSTSGGDLHRVDVSDEAVRLTRWLHALEPRDPEVTGLLALMLLTDARRPARTDASGELVPLPEQDRSRWDRALIAEGLALLDEAIAARSVGEYQLQAAVAAVHDRAATAADTDWPQVVALYGLLERMTGSPVVAVNRAVAVAMVDGPEAGLRLLDDVDLPGHRLDAVRAHLLESAGDLSGARAAYQRAAAAATSVPERRYLTLRAARLTLPA